MVGNHQDTQGTLEMLSRGDPLRYMVPNTFDEQMAMNQVQSNPLQGASELPIAMSDVRWPASDGWIKMQSIVTNSDGSKITIHYVFNKITGAFDDFKSK